MIITCDDVCDNRAHNQFKNKDKNPVRDILRKPDGRPPSDPRGSSAKLWLWSGLVGTAYLPFTLTCIRPLCSLSCH